ncbi:ParB family chromosome partitioning protein [Isoptericola sp. CG 20/1183]|uniref:ParB family chromosome partitioning protein n=1 Tax=Isoptericola halotolerans TaxID=300560 RepID=A0ABX5EH30_9MICO|nr:MULTISPECIES: ParB/RepB/Spo0J family partition protein [Isoptericola]PRZ08803.1 ParB family chromosome partitioning protein [Isoptericola halotolerans]PRZ10750.1 ParB family chromosome partitioning protein [Isoptericola sp. CG 20/1183]
MSQKKRGLGRGLGALIPQGPPQEKPVDVFFPQRDEEQEAPGAVMTAPDDDRGGERSERASEASSASADRGGRRSASWDSAIAGGRLSINGGSRAEDASDPVSALAGLAGRLESEAGRDAGAGYESLGTIEIREHDAPDDPASATEATEDAPGSDGAARSGEAGETFAQDVGEEHPHDEDGLVPVPGARFAEVPVEQIRPNSRQPRSVFDEGELDELVESINEIGVLQPIVVRPDPDASAGYELIMGERRWRAAQEAGLDTIPAIIRSTDDSDMLRDALLENLHRAALNPLEEAAAYRQLLDDFGCTHEELATRIARSRPQISNTLRLLKLPPLVQRRVAAGVLSAGHARALLGLSDGAEIERLAQRIVSEGLSVRATEEVVTLLAEGSDEQPAARAPRAGQRSEAMDELATRLSDRFETRVKVNLGKTKGKVTVEFASVEDLNRILAVMAPEDPGFAPS